MRGKAAFAYRVYPTRSCAGISAMRCFQQIRRWKRRYSERTLTGAFPAALPLLSVATGKSIVTSGIDERYFIYEGKRYHHVLDPFTGFPADTGLASATILSDSSAQGDALSTTCLLLGPEDGMSLVESLDGVEALFITTDGQQIASSGFDAYRAEQ